MKISKVENSKNLELYQVDGFLTKVECDRIISIIDENNVRSTVVADSYGKTSVSKNRTSSTCNFNLSDKFMGDINNKLHEVLPDDISISLSESPQGQKYEPGQFFGEHTDYFHEEYGSHHTKHLGQRNWTFMVYLNDLEEGGETHFPRLGLKFKPKMGTAVIWRNTDKDGNVLPDSLHAGLPPVSGTKYIITKWFREGLRKEKLKNRTFNSADNIPKVTPKGFKVVKVPDNTWKLIKEAYDLLKSKKRDEHVDWVLENKDKKIPTEIFPFDNLPQIKSLIHDQLKPIHEEWSGEKLLPSYIYGIRSYKKGSILKAHKDKIETHHISSIIVVDKNENDPNWGLDIQSHDGKWHKVFVDVGDMILYESAACEHARLDENPNEYFRNFFVHYKFKDITYEK